MKGKKVWVSVALTLAMCLGFAASASASASWCSTGYACMWGENQYTGCFKQFFNSATSLGNWTTCPGVTANNGANSVRVETVNCDRVRYHEDVSYGGAALEFNRIGLGYNYQDPNLGNGGGVLVGSSGSSNWNNRISSVRMLDC